MVFGVRVRVIDIYVPAHEIMAYSNQVVNNVNPGCTAGQLIEMLRQQMNAYEDWHNAELRLFLNGQGLGMNQQIVPLSNDQYYELRVFTHYNTGWTHHSN